MNNTNVIEFDFNKQVSVDIFSDYETQSECILEDSAKTNEYTQKALDLCSKLSDLPYIGKYIEDILFLCSMIKDYSSGIYKSAPISTIISILAAIIYLVSPADLIPDYIPVIGLVDDMTVLKMVIDATSKDVTRYKEWKESENVA